MPQEVAPLAYTIPQAAPLLKMDVRSLAHSVERRIIPSVPHRGERRILRSYITRITHTAGAANTGGSAA